MSTHLAIRLAAASLVFAVIYADIARSEVVHKQVVTGPGGTRTTVIDKPVLHYNTRPLGRPTGSVQPHIIHVDEFEDGTKCRASNLRDCIERGNREAAEIRARNRAVIDANSNRTFPPQVVIEDIP